LGYSASLLDDRLTIGLDFAFNWHRNTIWFVQDPSKMNYIEIGGLRFPDISSTEGFSFANHSQGLDGHNLDLQVVGKPSDNTRFFVAAGYRQVFFNHTGRFDKIEPVYRLGGGADLKTAFGLGVSLRAFYTATREAWLLDPASTLEPGQPFRVPACLLVNARVAWKVSSQPLDLTIGLEGFNLLDRRFREASGMSIPNQPDFNAERLDRRIVVFVQGTI